MFYHRGLAEAFGVTQEQLEEMTLREVATRAYDLGDELIFREEGGAGPGLTFTSESKEGQSDGNKSRE